MVEPRGLCVLRHSRNERRDVRKDERKLEQPPTHHATSKSRFSKRTINKQPRTVRQCLSGVGIDTEALKRVLQEFYPECNSVGFVCVARDVSAEAFPLSFGMVLVFNPGCRIKIVLLVIYPTLVGVDEGLQSGGIEVIGAPASEICWDVFDDGRNYTGLRVSRYPRRREPQQVVFATLHDTAVYTDGWIGEKIAE